MEACLRHLQNEHMHRLRFDFKTYPVVWIQGEYVRLCVYDKETYVWKLQYPSNTNDLINRILSGNQIILIGKAQDIQAHKKRQLP